eukprot:m51a1_g1370 putative tfiih basal transcription factor complex helicase xpd subunit-like (1065) ;mRNA; f:415787-420582
MGGCCSVCLRTRRVSGVLELGAAAHTVPAPSFPVAYDPKGGLLLILGSFRGTILRRVWNVVLAVAIVSVVVTVLQREGVVDLSIGTTCHTFLGLALSLLLVFRTNSCYERWRDGRVLLASLVNRSRSFVLKCCAVIHDDPYKESRHILLLNEDLTALNDTWGQLIRIRDMPTPFAYAHHIKSYLLIFCITAPFAMLATMGVTTPVASVLLTYALFGLDEIAVEIEEPFGRDPNDLPLDVIFESAQESLMVATEDAQSLRRVVDDWSPLADQDGGETPTQQPSQMKKQDTKSSSHVNVTSFDAEAPTYIQPLKSSHLLPPSFDVEDLGVAFPYPRVYPEQYRYMRAMLFGLRARAPSLIEMPSGTGKTAALLSLAIAYQAEQRRAAQDPAARHRVLYCSRTVQEISQATEEARRVVERRGGSELAVCLSSRKNLCINAAVCAAREGRAVDSLCRDRTATWGFEQKGQTMNVGAMRGVHSLEDLKELGRRETVCPYFLARAMAEYANVVLCSYQYAIDPRIAEHVTSDFGPDTVCIFDEAHNIDNVCIEVLSRTLTSENLGLALKNLDTLVSKVNATKAIDMDKMQREYTRLVNDVARPHDVPLADDIAADPLLPDDVLQEAVPGNIRKSESFLRLLRVWLAWLVERIRAPNAWVESSLRFVSEFARQKFVDANALRFFSSRLASLVRTLELSESVRLAPLATAAEMATIAATYDRGFRLLLEPAEQAHLSSIALVCLDSSVAMQAVVRRFPMTVLTSGTLSPLDVYTAVLGIAPAVTESFGMTVVRNCLSAAIVTRGADQVPITTKFETRYETPVIRNYGDLLLELSSVVPDGIVCFFPSYGYLEQVVSRWEDLFVLSKIRENKLVFSETQDPVETSWALHHYKRCCEIGRGAVMLAVARGRLSEGIDFSRHYGRCAVVFGVPYTNTQSRILKARLEFLSDRLKIREEDFLSFDAMRAAAQCVGRVLRGKDDYAAIVFADRRFSRADKISKLPRWIAEAVRSSGLTDTSSDVAVGQVREFMLRAAQPFPREMQEGVSLWSAEDIARYRQAQLKKQAAAQQQQQHQ